MSSSTWSSLPRLALRCCAGCARKANLGSVGATLRATQSAPTMRHPVPDTMEEVQPRAGAGRGQQGGTAGHVDVPVASAQTHSRGHAVAWAGGTCTDIATHTHVPGAMNSIVTPPTIPTPAPMQFCLWLHVYTLIRLACPACCGIPVWCIRPRNAVPCPCIVALREPV